MQTRSHGYNLAQLHFPCSASQCVSFLMVLLQQKFMTLQEKTFSQRTILQANLSLDFVLSLEKCKIWIVLKGVRRSPGFLANVIPDTPRFFLSVQKPIEEIQNVSMVKQKAALTHLQSELLFRCFPYHGKNQQWLSLLSHLPNRSSRRHTPKIKILCCKEHGDLNNPEISRLHKSNVLSKLLC